MATEAAALLFVPLRPVDRDSNPYFTFDDVSERRSTGGPRLFAADLTTKADSPRPAVTTPSLEM